jgi:hypothetical protein
VGDWQLYDGKPYCEKCAVEHSKTLFKLVVEEKGKVIDKPSNDVHAGLQIPFDMNPKIPRAISARVVMTFTDGGQREVILTDAESDKILKLILAPRGKYGNKQFKFYNVYVMSVTMVNEMDSVIRACAAGDESAKMKAKVFIDNIDQQPEEAAKQ